MSGKNGDKSRFHRERRQNIERRRRNRELLKSLAGIEMTHVPYKGGGPAMNDLIGG